MDSEKETLLENQTTSQPIQTLEEKNINVHNEMIDELKTQLGQINNDNANIILQCDKKSFERLINLLIRDEVVRNTYRKCYHKKKPSARVRDNRIKGFELKVLSIV